MKLNKGDFIMILQQIFISILSLGMIIGAIIILLVTSVIIGIIFLIKIFKAKYIKININRKE